MRFSAVVGHLHMLLSCAAFPHYARHGLGSEADSTCRYHPARGLQAPGKNGVMLMNRIAPSASQLYIANIDGTNERLLLGNQSAYEYHATFSADGKYIAFTSERNGDGNSDLYMVGSDGTGLRPIATTPAVEDAVSLSPDGKYAAYASTFGVWTSNIWLTDLQTGASRNLTNQTGITGKPESPSGFFAPSWSPDGEWIVFSSDRDTAWTNHNGGLGWEHTQNLSIYAIRPDGTGFRKVYSHAQGTVGSPKFSPDGSRIVFYNMSLQNTWDSRQLAFSAYSSMTNQIVSVDFETGSDILVHTSTAGCKISPQYVTSTNVGYLVKGGPNPGIHYTGSNVSIPGNIRSPSWSPDGTQVVYEKTDWTTRPLEKPLYSWDPDWAYRFTDVFPEISQQGKLVYTSKQTGNSSIMTMNPDGSNQQTVFNALSTNQVSAGTIVFGGGGAFQPSWSADGEWITFGLGAWFQNRYTGRAWIYRVTANGSHYEQLTTNATGNAGFPTFSPDGTKIVFRVFEPDFGLRVLDLATREISVLTTGRDNLPQYSPDGTKILFTRNVTDIASGQFSNYEICTVNPDGSGLEYLTNSAANDAHASWTADGRVLWSSGMWGFQAEAATYDELFQPYGQIMVMNKDGSDKRVLTNSIWEDSMPVYVPNSLLKREINVPFIV